MIGARLLQRLLAAGRRAAQTIRGRLVTATRPSAPAPIAGALAGAARSRSALIAENAFLRRQFAILRRGAKRPRCTRAERALLVVPAGRARAWRSVLLIAQPDAPLRWYRESFRGYWRRKSRAATPAHHPPLTPETVAPIGEMAAANRLWGAARICGELRTLEIRVAKSTIQKYLREARPLRGAGQPRATFLHDHADAIWACDFLPVADLPFGPV
jgi:putative transposase